MIKLCVLASSSKGNSTFIRMDNDTYLIDAGISVRRIERILKGINENLRDVSDVILTHEHNDHIAGVKTLGKRFSPKFWLTYETYQRIRNQTGAIDAEFIEVGESFNLNKFKIEPFEISHDAVNPIALLFSINEIPQIGYLCDCGYITPYLLDGFRNTRILIIEANHSFDLLLQSSYPYHLKHRILGSKGHLSNWHTAEFISKTKPEIVILGHISENNNTPEVALGEIDTVLGHKSNFNHPFFVIMPTNQRSVLVRTNNL